MKNYFKQLQESLINSSLLQIFFMQFQAFSFSNLFSASFRPYFSSNLNFSLIKGMLVAIPVEILNNYFLFVILN